MKPVGTIPESQSPKVSKINSTFFFLLTIGFPKYVNLIDKKNSYKSCPPT